MDLNVVVDVCRGRCTVCNLKEGGAAGRVLKLQIEDTRESISGAQAVTAFNKLVDVDGLSFIIGPSWSPGALAIAPLASKRKNLVLITPSASAEAFSKSAAHIFNMRPTERLATEGLADFAYKNGWHRAAVFTSQQPAEFTQGKIFADRYAAIGGIISKHLETNPELQDVRSEALQIKSSNPDVVFLMAYNQINSAANSLKQLGYRGPILAISLDENRVAAAKGALEGVYVAKALLPGKVFRTNFVKTYNEPPGLSAENGYDAIYALVEAIKVAESTRADKVAAALMSIEFDGASGRIKFDPHGGVKQEPALFIVKNGKLVPLSWKADNGARLF